MRLDVYTYTSSGGREYNEDFADGCIDGEEAVFVLADGLGGHYGGEEASRFVVQNLLDAWKENVRKDMSWEEWFQNQLEKANHALLDLQKEVQGRMKTTVAVLCLDKDQACWAHVGDTRIYRLSDGEIHCLTEDHSVTYKKYRSGEIRKADINFDEDRSSLLRAVGDKDHCIADCGRAEEGETLCPGDAFLLCTDGFWGYLQEEEILIDYLKSECARNWGKQMLLRVMERILPDSDNLTFTAVWIQEDTK